MNKIGEKMGSIITKEEIVRIWILAGGSKNRENYAFSILLGRKLIENIARGLYRILDNQSGDSIQDQDYWTIIEKLIGVHSPSGGIVGGEKALEIHLQNYSTPDILIIYTRDTQLRVSLKNGREIHFRTLISGEKTGGKNLFRLLSDESIVFKENKKIQILSVESALLDALSLRRHDAGIEESNILKFLKLYHMRLSREKLGILVRYRYIRALNRLRSLSRDNGYTELYQKTLDIIRDEGGGCYLNI
ncbi:hypothetical protein KBD33_05520 [Candidatus Gracilibacteria bacterium]|nr:hypothetical protein [Candidatus Gracilibacteria bacterium]